MKTSNEFGMIFLICHVWKIRFLMTVKLYLDNLVSKDEVGH